MIQKIKRYLLIAVTATTLFAPALAAPASVAAAGNPGAGCTGVNKPLSEGVNVAVTNNGATTGDVNCQDTNVNDDAIKKLAAKVTNTFSIIVGAISVIMIIYGGFRYITSGGESGRVGAAKNALLYAIVGLVIVALAQLIIHFVLSQATNVTNGT